MPTYEFKCRDCASPTAVACSIAQYTDGLAGSICPACGGQLGRHYSTPPAVPTLFQPHYNTSVGAYVTSPRDYADRLKVASEEASARTGIEHRYVPVDMRDRDVVGVSGEGLDETARRRHDAGMDARGLDGLTG